MDSKTTKGTLIYQEMDVDIAREWFIYKPQKFIAHVDSLYYNVTIEGDSRLLLADLSRLKQQAIQSRQPQIIHDNIFMDAQSKSGYTYHLTKTDEFKILINETASMIQVQLHSMSIWLNGLERAFEYSLSTISSIFNSYGISIIDITESRVDIAHHTNYIQDFHSFFRENDLAAMQVSRLKRYVKQGNLKSDSAIADYVAFGNRSNVYLRIYIKSKEIIEKYKQFFVPIWFENGLISEFDKYIYDDIFENAQGQYEYRHISRCKFYLEYGQDEAIKDNIRLLLKKGNTTYSDYKKLADTYVPDLTTITNIEFQVDRNFTRSLNLADIDYQSTPQTKAAANKITAMIPDGEHRIRSIINAIPTIRKHLVTKTIYFVDFKGKNRTIEKSKRPTAAWWKRLTSCGGARVNATLSREYQYNADAQRLRVRAIKALASVSAHDGMDDLAIGDIYTFADSLNYNDTEKYYRERDKRI